MRGRRFSILVRSVSTGSIRTIDDLGLALNDRMGDLGEGEAALLAGWIRRQLGPAALPLIRSICGGISEFRVSR
jgi:hypothetical protein